MVCTASRQAEALRRIDIQHSKRRRAGLDSPYPRDQRSAGRSQKPARAHLQRNAAKRFRERLHLLLDGSSARVWIRAGKTGSVTDAETAAKVERIRCNAGFLIQFLRQRSKLCEHSGIKVLVHTQIAQPHTKSEPFCAVHMQTVCHAQKFLTLHPGIGSHDASNRFRAAAQRPLLAQEQNRRFRRFLRKQVGSVQHENRAERTRSLLGFRAAKQRFIGNLSVMEPAPCSKFQLCAAPAEHTAAAAVQNLQNSGIRIHADGKARQESVAVGKCTEKSLRCLHETLFIV